MILLDPEVFGPSIAVSHGNSKRLLLAYKSWMLLVMSLVAVLIRMPEAYAVNVTVKSTMVSMTSYHATEVLPTGDIVSLMKGKKPIVIPENEVITSEDSEDYLEEDSEEDYETELKKENASGELGARRLIALIIPTHPQHIMSFRLCRQRPRRGRQMRVHLRQASASRFLQSTNEQVRVRKKLSCKVR